ncbi:MAG: Nif3-like dinuclear metal center hexameric protein [Phycisphaeraceae bacterium]
MQLHRVLDTLRPLAPEALAEEWDRVGLHVGALDQTIKRGLLCIDLTEPVVDEAIRERIDLIVAYHPPIFQPLTEVTDQHVKPRIVMRLVQAGIAVYSPHTALDAAPEGVNDWLAAGVGEGEVRPIKPAGEDALAEAIGATGQGRIVELTRAVTLNTLADRLKKHLGVKHLEVAPPQGATRRIKRIGLCAGAGGSLLDEAGPIDAFFTGEMRHHDVLAATAAGTAIFLAGHTQTERPYLPTYRQRIAAALGDAVEWRISKADRAPSTIR